MTRPHSLSPTKTPPPTRSLRAASGTPLPPRQNVQASDFARNRHCDDMLRKIEGLEISPPIRPNVSPSGVIDLMPAAELLRFLDRYCCDAKFYRLVASRARTLSA